ncbi:MAG TPA: hypothetical protein PLI09_20815 [Candidatus Hydrogenedentes bacterium]|nr:hypothetical protein [Candidatus Hydrogenedentota bacterium]
MDSAEQVRQIMALPLFQSIPAATQQQYGELFLAVGEWTDLMDGEVLLHQGGLGGDTGYVLLKGNVVVERENMDPLVVPAPTLLGEMSQINPHAQRMATVSSKGRAEVLTFSWREFYAKAKAMLTQSDLFLLMECIERSVLKRFQREALMDLPQFRRLPDELRMRICLYLQWEIHPVPIAAGAKLFEAKGMCGDTGYLLTQGEVDIVPAVGRPLAIHAPDIVGVLPKFEPELRWTCTAVVKGNVEIHRFSWLVFMNLLEKRLQPAEFHAVRDALALYAKDHFTH